MKAAPLAAVAVGALVHNATAFAPQSSRAKCTTALAVGEGADLLDPTTTSLLLSDPTLLLAGAGAAVATTVQHGFGGGFDVGAWNAADEDALFDAGTALAQLPKRLQPRSSPAAAAKDETAVKNVRFVSPLLEDCYPPAVAEYEAHLHTSKPLCLYLPGFDGTILAPFLQFPSLGEEFDLRAMKVDDMSDRSTFDELKEKVVEYVLAECKARRRGDATTTRDEVYLFGESFGGILATEVALELKKQNYEETIDLKGLVLVNPATCYQRSMFKETFPPIATADPIPPLGWGPLGGLQYVISMIIELTPLLLIEKRFIQQLVDISTFKGLPSVANDAQREAYMGRVIWALPSRIHFIPKETLQWRLTEWLERGSVLFEDRLKKLQASRSGDSVAGLVDADTRTMQRISEELQTMIVVGELDALPSEEEAERLTSEMYHNACVHVVPGAGHVSTCGATLNLIQLIRNTFTDVGSSEKERGDSDAKTLEDLHGLEPRYDGETVGMLPWQYWSKENYREVHRIQ
ncbi:hypothetical protein ACHAXT_003359 [Thalassiosira profunda]